MGVFKRICLLAFGLAGLLSLVALALPWWGPWTDEARALLSVYWYYVTLECLIYITTFGLLVCLARALFTRNRKVIVVAKVKGDAITITRDAIAAQVVHMIEDGQSFRARRVRVRAKSHGHVRVACRVQPLHAMSVVSEGKALHDMIATGLQTVCGDHVDKIQIEFIDAGSHGSTFVDGGAEVDGMNDAAKIVGEHLGGREGDIAVPPVSPDGAVVETAQMSDSDGTARVLDDAFQGGNVVSEASDDSSEIRLPMPRLSREGDGGVGNPGNMSAAVGTDGGSGAKGEG